MQVRVLFFGVLKDLAGRRSEVISLPDQATAADVLDHYERSFGEKKGLLASIAISVNQEYAAGDCLLHPGDEVGLLPPVSGGTDDQPYVRLVHQRIVQHDIVPTLERPED